MTMDETKIDRGWGFPGASRKAHYFVNGMALCGKWMYTGHLEADQGKSSPDDCAACRRALAKAAGAVTRSTDQK
jgi:hypothetical protein